MKTLLLAAALASQVFAATITKPNISGITVTSYSDPSFESTAREVLAENIELYRPVLPISIIATNTGSTRVTAIAIRWDHDAGSERLVAESYSPGNSGRTIAPGESVFLAPGLFKHRGEPTFIPAERLAEIADGLRSATIVVDTVVFENGAAYGPQRAGLVTRIQGRAAAARKAEQLPAASLASLAKSGSLYSPESFPDVAEWEWEIISLQDMVNKSPEELSLFRSMPTLMERVKRESEAIKAAAPTVNAAPKVIAVKIDPPSVIGGVQTLGLVSLDQKAGSRGVKVNLSSSIPAAASVPSFITVPYNSCSFSFIITTYQVNFTQVVTITASTSNQNQVTGTITVYPPAAITGGAGTACAGSLYHLNCTDNIWAYEYPMGDPGPPPSNFGSWEAYCSNGPAQVPGGPGGFWGWLFEGASCGQGYNQLRVSRQQKLQLLNPPGYNGVRYTSSLYSDQANTQLIMTSTGFRLCNGTSEAAIETLTSCGPGQYDYHYVWGWTRP